MSEALRYKQGTHGAPQVVDVDKRQVKFIFSTANPDRDSDSINQAGWQLDAFRKNPVALFGHDHHGLPVGKVTAVGIERGNLTGIIEFATHEFAETVYQLVKGGFLNAVSVGFRVLEAEPNRARGGVDFKRQELLEISVVPVPANAHALVAAEGQGISTRLLRSWARKVLDERQDEVVLDIDDDDSVLDISPEFERELQTAAVRRKMNAATLSGAVIDLDEATVRNVVRGEVRRLLTESLREQVATGVRQAMGRVD